MDRSKQKGTFTGSIDELLMHCENIDVEKLYADCEKRECIAVLMRDAQCSEEEAEILYKEIALNEVKNTVDELVKDGLVEISGFNEDGEPLFTLTELGKSVQDELKKNKQ
jgi:hypothetical protein